ncbi:MAG: hypothetical protein QOJ45_2099 [Verrucomicrobiota bacterium]|jgi:hypothetical protein
MSRSTRKYAIPQKQLFPLTTKNKLPITKIDAARRQLETATRLWFADADPVSIHTLTMAAHEILRVFNKRDAGPSMLTEPSDYIRPEYHRAYEELMLKSYNFFKHGAKDAETTDWFNPGKNVPLMLDAAEAYFRIASERPPILQVFRNYWRTHRPGLFVEESDLKIDTEILTWSKSRFFSEMLPVATLATANPPAGGSRSAAPAT